MHTQYRSCCAGANTIVIKSSSIKFYQPKDSPLRNWVSRLAAGELKDKAGFRASSPWHKARPEHPDSLMDTEVGEEWETRGKHWKRHQNRTLTDLQNCPRKKIAVGA